MPHDLARELWTGLGWPLVRLTLAVSLGLFVATLVETLDWTRGMARLASPLIRLARLKDVSGASFSLAWFSSVAANGLLAEAVEKGEMTRRELALSNLFNSLPAYFVHLPSLFFLVWSVLGAPAVIYVGLTLGASFLRTAAIVLYGRLTLPELPEGCVVCRLDERARPRTLAEALARSWKRFTKRIRRTLLYTLPIYAAIWLLNRLGAFQALDRFLADRLSFLDWLDPRTLSIVVFHMIGEFSGALAAAGAVLQDAGQGDGLPLKDVVLALLAGNILSSPMRAFRQQFPSYAGIFPPGLAAWLVVNSQLARAASLTVVAAGFWLLA